MARNKVTIVGAGNVGATTAHWLIEREVADLVLVDIPQVEGMPQGKSLDMLQAGPVMGYDAQITGTTSYEPTANSDVVVITAGLARKPGMTREDLVGRNQEIITDVIQKVIPGSPNAIYIVVTNPLDTMTYLAYKVSGLPRERILGQAGVLDGARFRTFIAQELQVSVENTHAFVLGGHGDEMVPLPRYSTVAGIPITELMTTEQIDRLVERTRKGGAEIVSLLKTGSAYYAPGASVAKMVEAILKDRKLIVPCSVYLDGEYGIKDLFFGVPVKLGRKGVEQIVEIKLQPDEKIALDKSVELIRSTMSALKL
ncbi:MAG: malate dehydrogenase [Chloroflexi bacterium]|nr:malate dehydrogenase [Chloroflexota bacterium]